MILKGRNNASRTCDLWTAAENTQRLELYTHLFVILHMLIDVMGNNALQKCWHTCTMTKCSVVTWCSGYYMHTKMLLLKETVCSWNQEAEYTEQTKGHTMEDHAFQGLSESTREWHGQSRSLRENKPFLTPHGFFETSSRGDMADPSRSLGVSVRMNSRTHD